MLLFTLVLLPLLNSYPHLPPGWRMISTWNYSIPSFVGNVERRLPPRKQSIGMLLQPATHNNTTVLVQSPQLVLLSATCVSPHDSNFTCISICSAFLSCHSPAWGESNKVFSRRKLNLHVTSSHAKTFLESLSRSIGELQKKNNFQSATDDRNWCNSILRVSPSRNRWK